MSIPGWFAPGTGKIAGDFDVRLTFFKAFGRRRPPQSKIKRITGTCATIGYGMESNPYHWMVDCLPKLISLGRAEPVNPITLIMSDKLGDQQRETLAALCPANFDLQYHPRRYVVPDRAAPLALARLRRLQRLPARRL